MLRSLFLAPTLFLSLYAFAGQVRLGAEFPLSPTPNFDQSSVVIAEGIPTFAAWIENNSNVVTSLRGVVTSRTAVDRNSGSGVDVARGSETFLLVWGKDAFTVVAQRYGLDGSPLDAEPIVIAKVSSPVPQVNVAWNGANYLVTWSDVSLRARRMTESGQLVDAPFVVMAAPTGEFTVDPAVASDGTGFFIAASGYVPILVDPGPALEPTRIWFAHVGASGAASTATVPIFSAESNSAFNTTGVAITVVEGQPTIFWVDKRPADPSGNPWTAEPCIHAVQPPSPPRTLRCLDASPLSLTGDFISLDVAWNGSDFAVVVWNRLGVASAERFDRNLDPIDAAPVELAWNTGLSRISAVRSGNAVMIAYTRTDADDDERVFARTLEVSDEPPPPRRRGVRH